MSEAQIKIVKLETQLESKQALSTSTTEQTTPLKRNIETQTENIPGVDIHSQTEPLKLTNKESSLISDSLSTAPYTRLIGRAASAEGLQTFLKKS